MVLPFRPRKRVGSSSVHLSMHSGDWPENANNAQRESPEVLPCGRGVERFWDAIPRVYRRRFLTGAVQTPSGSEHFEDRVGAQSALPATAPI
jgi:hypothetical protein